MYQKLQTEKKNRGKHKNDGTEIKVNEHDEDGDGGIEEEKVWWGSQKVSKEREDFWT